ncbi:hypothetical protein [Persephonella sp.]
MKKLIFVVILAIGLAVVNNDLVTVKYEEVKDSELDEVTGRGFINGGNLIIEIGNKKIILWDEIELGTKGGNK